MEKRKKLGIISIIAGVVVAVAILLAMMFMGNQTIEVITASHSIAKGEVIQEKDLNTINFKKYNIPSTYITSKESCVGKYASVDIVANDVLISSKISGTATVGDDQFLDIGSGQQGISFTVSGGAGLANKLMPGDIIRIYQYKNGKVNTIDSLQYVRVQSVASSDGANVDDSAKKEGKTYAYITAIVYTAQAKDIVRIENEGKIYVSILSRGNTEKADMLLKKQESILDKLNATA